MDKLAQRSTEVLHTRHVERDPDDVVEFFVADAILSKLGIVSCDASARVAGPNGKSA